MNDLAFKCITDYVAPSCTSITQWSIFFVKLSKLLLGKKVCRCVSKEGSNTYTLQKMHQLCV